MACPPSKPGLFSYLGGWSNEKSGFGSNTEVDEVVRTQDIQGKVIFVTGATSPIARALCASLYRHGATVVLGVHGTPDRGDALVTELQATSQSSQQKQAQQQEERQPGTDQPQSEQLQQEQQQQQEGLHGSRKAGGESAEQKGGHQTQDQVLAGKLLHVPCDFSSLAGAKACADAFQALCLPLHVLINCAATINTCFNLTPDKVEEHFGVNHLAPFLLTARLLPLLATSASSQRSPGQAASPRQDDTQNHEHQHGDAGSLGVGRVVWVSCSAHYITYLPSRGAGRHAAWWPVQGQGSGYGWMSPQAYGLSKTATILGSRECAKRCAAAGLPVAALSVHPGVTSDGLKRYGGYSSDSIAHKMKSALADGMAAIKCLKSHSQAAASIAYAALAPELVTGAHPPTMAGSETAAGSVEEGMRREVGPASQSPQVAADAEPSSSSGTGRSSQNVQHKVGEAEEATGLENLVRTPGRAALHAYIEDCNVSRPSPLACDDELACTLYELSESLAANQMDDTAYATCLYPNGV